MRRLPCAMVAKTAARPCFSQYHSAEFSNLPLYDIQHAFSPAVKTCITAKRGSAAAMQGALSQHSALDFMDSVKMLYQGFSVTRRYVSRLV
jgi:hypothetical protein